jgi:hypothetical protein
LLVFVQIFDAALALSVDPAGIEPTAPPPVDDGLLRAPGFDCSVLPLRVVRVVGSVRRGCVRGVERDDVRAGVRAGALAAGVLDDVAGTSLSCGCAVVSVPAMARSRFNALSAPSAVVSGPFFASELHAASAATAPIISDVRK